MHVESSRMCQHHCTVLQSLGATSGVTTVPHHLVWRLFWGTLQPLAPCLWENLSPLRGCRTGKVYRQVLDTNVVGPFLVALDLLPSLRKKESRTIVQVGAPAPPQACVVHATWAIALCY